jgi:hypothetical protein
MRHRLTDGDADTNTDASLRHLRCVRRVANARLHKNADSNTHNSHADIHADEDKHGKRMHAKRVRLHEYTITHTLGHSYAAPSPGAVSLWAGLQSGRNLLPGS